MQRVGSVTHSADLPGASGYTFEPLLNDEKAAEMLGGMHPKTLQRMARSGQIPAHKIGRFWYFRASELDRWITGELHSACQSRPRESKEIQ
jgi:excisionase family DNA binding protein